jgi:tetratricopeptide (TPR) repeat protein
MIAPLADPDLVAALRALLAAGRYRDASELWQRAPEAEAQRSEALLLAATASMRQGDVAEANALATRAAATFHARADRDGHLRALNLLGAVAFERGELDLAAERFDAARSLAMELGDTLFQAHATNNRASVAHLRGNAAEAMSLYRAALLDYQRLGDRRGTAQTYHNLGIAFRDLAAWDDAEKASAQALRHATMIEDASLAALALTGRAELELARGANALATRALDRASQLALDAGDVLGEAEIGRVRAMVALREGRVDAAVREAQRASETAAAQGSALLAAECAAVMALALHRLGRAKEAGSAREDALARFAALGAEAHAERFRVDWKAAG